ncbi:MAG: ATP-binding protein [Candidatus Latescibacterota bacterium]
MSPFRILVVDDEEDIVASLGGLLRDEGYEVVSAGSGEEGLSRTAGADLVVLDLMLPGIDGLETLRRIKEQQASLPVVMMSGHGTVSEAVEAVRAGAYDFLEKPLSGEKVLVMVENVLQWRRLEEKNAQLEIRVRQHTAELEEQNRALAQANQKILEATQAKSMFLAKMSHELRTPLNAILGFTELMEDGIFGAVPDSFQEPVAEIHKSGDHLLALINDVLDLSKIEAGRMSLHLSVGAIEGCVASVVATMGPLAKEKGLPLRTALEAGLPLCMMDEGRITQVLLNLVGNAIKFTQVGEVEIGAQKEAEGLLVWVRDTGIGIPAEKLEEIFTEFGQVDASITRNTQGTGLGLSISRHIVEMHGGRIGVESQEGKGSRFWFTLPMQPAGPVNPSNPLNTKEH